MDNYNKINIGIVGAGHLGSFHIEQYQKLNGVHLVGFIDIDDSQVNRVQNKYSINAFDSLEKLFEECDAVSVATPTTTHFSIAKKAMERKTGARGLRSIIERILMETMYKVPSESNLQKVVLDASVIQGEYEPLMVYESKKEKKSG